MRPICLLLLLLAVELTVGDSDIDALLEFKKGIQSDPSGKILASWDSKSLASDGCPKNWYGVNCRNGHVTSITLNDLGIVGEFDFHAISRILTLRNLSVSNNQFSGTVTKEVGLIESLESLDLSSNLFTGSVPSQFSGLKNLVLFNISSNKLGGEIPPGCFASMTMLKFLDLHSNGFVGDVMGLLAHLGGVQRVDLSCNGFSGLLDLGIGDPDFISSVRFLNISNNKLSGELFSHDGIPYFDSLEVFDASENGFVGNVPSFSFVVSLRIIKLRNNQLTGSLPQGLLQESSMILSELDLSHNQLEGPVESITSVNLRNLNLSSNRLSGPLPARIGRCAILDLSNNMFSGNVSRAQSWGNYVEVINLSSNKLSGFLPNQTSQFLRLTSLKISNNSLEGGLPPVLAAYPELKVIDFSFNKLSDLLLPTLLNSTKLTDINLSSNNFSGLIPAEMVAGQNYSLISLNLSHNALVGRFPSELGRFQNIVFLDLSDNRLEGGIPDDLPDTMVGFNVSYNNLSGVVPRSLQRFPASSFHPGNYLLTLPNEAPSAKGGGNSSLRSHGSHMKSAIKAALIAGLVGGVSVIAVLGVMIYCRVHQEESKQSGEKKVLSSVGTVPANQPIEVSSAIESLQDHNLPETTRKSESISSSIPMKSSENPNALEVCSPDKLAGDLHLFDSSLKFTPEELSSAPAEAVGMSCHGTLYKAVLSSGEMLAVKLMKEGIAKGRKEFAREAKKLGNIRHPNLVSLQGFYWGPKEHEKLIISKYIDDAPCLALYLHGTDPQMLPSLSLQDRLKIVRDIACCLTYLHTEGAIPHGNLKTTNILIQNPNKTALLTDYTLHRLLTSAGTADQVLNAGRLGYLPPEFTSTSKPCPSLKSDVYAFGILMLELLTGRSCADIVPGKPGVVDLSEWVRTMAVENRAVECFDPQILGDRSAEGLPAGLDEMLRIALKCILPAAERPDVKMVFEELSCVVL